MKVYNLCCEHDHRFEGWFASEQDFSVQHAASSIACPVCNSVSVSRQPSAPRIRRHGDAAPDRTAAVGGADAAVQEIQKQVMRLMREVVTRSEDVGSRFAEEARRIHYAEAPERPIRGQASGEECAALIEEGIDVLPLPAALTEPLQ